MSKMQMSHLEPVHCAHRDKAFVCHTAGALQFPKDLAKLHKTIFKINSSIKNNAHKSQSSTHIVLERAPVFA